MDLMIFSLFKGLVRIFSCLFLEGVLVSALNLTVLSKVALLNTFFLFTHLRVVIMKFEAQVRSDLGKGASRRLRHTNKFPAIIYGGTEAPVAIELKHDDVINQMDKEGFYDAITLVIDGKEVNVKPQDIQRHPFKPKVQHMDFIRI